MGGYLIIFIWNSSKQNHKNSSRYELKEHTNFPIKRLSLFGLSMLFILVFAENKKKKDVLLNVEKK